MDRTRTMGIYTFVSVAGGSIGLLLGGLLTQTLSWHWIFFINIPIGVIALAFGWRGLPREQGRGLGEGLDVVGSILVTAGALLGIFAVVGAESHGILAASTIAPFVVAVGLLISFVAWESRAKNPILPLSLGRRWWRRRATRCVVLAGFELTYSATQTPPRAGQNASPRARSRPTKEATRASHDLAARKNHSTDRVGFGRRTCARQLDCAVDVALELRSVGQVYKRPDERFELGISLREIVSSP
jgi:hypothetical protein